MSAPPTTRDPEPRTRDTVRRLLAYFRPHSGGLALALLLVSLHSVVPGAIVLLIQRVLDDVLIAQDRTMLALVPAAVVVLYGLNGFLTYTTGMLTRGIAWRVVTRLRQELFEHLLRLDLAWHQRTPTGAVLSRLTQDVVEVQYGVSGILTAVQKPLTLVLLIAAAVYMNPELSALAVVVLPFVAFPIHRFGLRLRRAAQDRLTSHGSITASAQESLTGVAVIQTSGGEALRGEAFWRENERHRRDQMRTFAAQLLPGPVVEIIAALAVGLVIWVGGRQVFAGDVQPGELIAFMVALGLINDPLKGITKINDLTQRSVAGAAAVFEILDQEPAIRDTGSRALARAEGLLRFEEVGFDYGDGEVVEAVSLEVRPGRMVALVGASGAGKSTLARLVPRLADPTRGRVSLDGVDLREYRLADLRRNVAVVSQEGFLFDDTVRANIAFGRPGASDAELEAAARAANAHDFIVELPRGYETRIDELGLRLSGGQRQRLQIARAILRDAPVLVLDEATSSLDAESEAVVQEALDRLMASRTVLAVAHRLSTIKDADEIVVLDGGRVVERGRHEALLAAEGPYARLVRRQSGA